VAERRRGRRAKEVSLWKATVAAGSGLQVFRWKASALVSLGEESGLELARRLVADQAR
jgi:hypothetical protein